MIGREANRWEEQFHLGADPEAQSEYGMAPEDRERMLTTIRNAAGTLGLAALAHAASISRRHVGAILAGKLVATNSKLLKLSKAAAKLTEDERHQAATDIALRGAASRLARQIGQRDLARQLQVDQVNLSKVLARRRRVRAIVRERLAPNLASLTNTPSRR